MGKEKREQGIRKPHTNGIKGRRGKGDMLVCTIPRRKMSKENIISSLGEQREARVRV